MRILNLKKRNLEFKEFKNRFAQSKDYSSFVDYPFIGIEDGKIKIIYDILKADTSAVINSLMTIDYQTSERLDGLVSNSAIFGYFPRRQAYHDYCRSTVMARTHPEQHDVITNFVKQLCPIYEQHDPEAFKAQMDLVDSKIKPIWRIGTTPFTSGICNKDNQLKYHRDSGNFKKAKSIMIAFKHEVDGGFLSIPEYDIGIEISDKSILIFDGATVIHGVTPLIKMSSQAYRYSIVWYALEQLWKCMTPEEELKRIRLKKTERERKRALA